MRAPIRPFNPHLYINVYKLKNKGLKKALNGY